MNEFYWLAKKKQALLHGELPVGKTVVGSKKELRNVGDYKHSFSGFEDLGAKTITKKGERNMGNDIQSTKSAWEKLKKQLMIGVIIAIAILIAMGALVFKGYSSATEKYENEIKRLEDENKNLSDQIAKYTIATTEVSIDMITSKIQDVSELATIEYMYTDAGKFEDAKKLFGKDIFFTTKSFIAKWDGTIKAGIDMNQFQIELDKNKKEIVIHIPKAKILSHEIDKNSIETLDEKDGFFNPVKVTDVREFDAISKDAMEERAIENGLLDKALENAKEIIGNTIAQDGYTVTFVVAEQ